MRWASRIGEGEVVELDGPGWLREANVALVFVRSMVGQIAKAEKANGCVFGRVDLWDWKKNIRASKIVSTS